MTLKSMMTLTSSPTELPTGELNQVFQPKLRTKDNVDHAGPSLPLVQLKLTSPSFKDKKTLISLNNKSLIVTQEET